MKQYGPNFIHSPFPFKANKISHVARHAAIRNKVLKLSQLFRISKDKATSFLAGLDGNDLCYPCTDAIVDS